MTNKQGSDDGHHEEDEEIASAQTFGGFGRVHSVSETGVENRALLVDKLGFQLGERSTSGPGLGLECNGCSMASCWARLIYQALGSDDLMFV
jgi:hypothetical protein